MPWTITEQHLSGRLGPATNEDRVFSPNSHIFGVADGATTITGWMKDGRTAAQMAADTAVACASLIKPDTDPQEWFEHFILDTLAMRDIEKVPENEVTITTFVIFNAYTGQLWMRGDCQYAWEHADGKWESFEKPMSLLETTYCTLRSARINKLLELPENADWRTNAETRKRLATEGREVVRRQRKQDLAAVVEGQTNFPHYTPWENEAGVPPRLTVITVPAGVKKIVLASDGLPKLFPTKEETLSYRKRQNGRDPFHIGMEGNQNITPKGVVDHLTGNILQQGDDESALWLEDTSLSVVK